MKEGRTIGFARPRIIGQWGPWQLEDWSMWGGDLCLYNWEARFESRVSVRREWGGPVTVTTLDELRSCCRTWRRDAGKAWYASDAIHGLGDPCDVASAIGCVVC